MLKLNKMARQARKWSAVLANLAKTAYYASRTARWWEWADDWFGR